MPKKLIDFLEKNVEWFALGIGALWLAYVAYGYWLNAPDAATVELKRGQAETPATIDAAIRKGPVQSLREGIENGKPLRMPDTPVVSETMSPFRQQNYSAVAPVAPYANLVAVPPRNVDTGGQIVVKIGTTQKVDVPKGELVTLPKVPAPTFLDVFVGRANVARPAPNANPGLINPAGGAPAVVPAIREDKDWIKLFLSWPLQAYMDEMAKAKIPVDRHRVLVVRVEVEREELMPDGKWGNRAKVGNPMPLPANVNPGPAPAEAAAQTQWLNAVARDQERILRPQFYDIAIGDKDPGSAKDAKNPGQVTPATPRSAAPVAPVPQARYSAAPAAFNLDQFVGGDRLVAMAPGYRPNPDADFPEDVGPPPPGMGRPGLNPLPGVPAVPPAQNALEEFWIHDDSVKEGHVYRYRARLVLVNPLLNYAPQPNDQAAAKLKNATDAKVIELPVGADEGWSAWSNEVKQMKQMKIPPKTRFYVTTPPMVDPLNPARLKRNSVKVEVWTWSQGAWAKSLAEASPGDAVGNTGWTVVDIRAARNNMGTEDWQVILIDDRFQQEVRSVYQDSKNKAEMASLP